jgi:hypothetical protein
MNGMLLEIPIQYFLVLEFTQTFKMFNWHLVFTTRHHTFSTNWRFEMNENCLVTGTVDLLINYTKFNDAITRIT